MGGGDNNTFHTEALCVFEKSMPPIFLVYVSLPDIECDEQFWFMLELTICFKDCTPTFT